MLQSWGTDFTYEQPVQPIKVDGQRLALPPDFVQGLDFLRPFTVSNHHWMQWVHLIDGRLYAASNSLIVEYEIGPCELENTIFSAKLCRILAGFATPPEGVVIGNGTILFTWADGQELFVDRSREPVDYGGEIASMFKRHWTFGVGTSIDDETRKSLQSALDVRGSGDVFFDGATALCRSGTRTSETLLPYAANTEGLIRFDRKPFLAMLKVATEIDFAASPLCFRHAHGRGMLVRRAIGHDVPTFGGDND